MVERGLQAEAELEVAVGVARLDQRLLDARVERKAEQPRDVPGRNLGGRAAASDLTLADFEAKKREPYARTLADIRHTFEAAGVSFIEPDAGGWAGVRLREAPTV